MAGTPKKSVKFSDHVESPVEEESGFKVEFDFKLLPVHLIFLLYTLTQSDLTKDIFNLLLTNIYLLTMGQFINSFVFINSLVEIRKNKKRKFKFEISHLFIGLLISIGLILPIYILIVLFGAPFTTYLKENLLLSLIISLLCLPITIAFLKIGNQQILYKYLITIGLGCWLGAVVIPLDWDRPWQNWPMPIVFGAYIGAIIGQIVLPFIN